MDDCAALIVTEMCCASREHLSGRSSNVSFPFVAYDPLRHHCPLSFPCLIRDLVLELCLDRHPCFFLVMHVASDA
eukprot:8808770-Karenia_brevis.AAC.1